MNDGVYAMGFHSAWICCSKEGAFGLCWDSGVSGGSRDDVTKY